MSFVPDLYTWALLMAEYNQQQTLNVPDIVKVRLAAKTLRQRVFTSLLLHIAPLPNGYQSIEFKAPAEEHLSFDIKPKSLTLRGIMAACKADKHCRRALSSLPFIGRQLQVDPELRKSLQDLADLVAWEASEAFRAAYYPGIMDMEPIDPDHVRAVMNGLQREMDREGNRVQRAPAVFSELPWERQVALAERRRYWYGIFGITPKAWKTGRFSLWDVSNKITYPPDDYYCRWDKRIPVI